MSVKDTKIHTTARLPVGMLLEIEDIMEEADLTKNSAFEVLLSRGIASYRLDFPK